MNLPRCLLLFVVTLFTGCGETFEGPSKLKTNLNNVRRDVDGTLVVSVWAGCTCSQVSTFTNSLRSCPRAKLGTLEVQSDTGSETFELSPTADLGCNSNDIQLVKTTKEMPGRVTVTLTAAAGATVREGYWGEAPETQAKVCSLGSESGAADCWNPQR
jgi:hypothetical protein